MELCGFAGHGIEGGESTDHCAEGHTVLIHGRILNGTHDGSERGVELGHGEGSVHLLLCESEDSADTGCRADGAVGSGGVQEIIEVLGAESDADCDIVGHNQSGQVFPIGDILLETGGQNAGDEGCARVSLNHVVAVIDVEGVGCMTHGKSGAHEAEAIFASRNFQIAVLYPLFDQALSALELFALTAEDQGDHQIDTAVNCAALYFCGKIFPLCVQNIIF